MISDGSCDFGLSSFKMCSKVVHTTGMSVKNDLNFHLFHYHKMMMFMLLGWMEDGFSLESLHPSPALFQSLILSKT